LFNCENIFPKKKSTPKKREYLTSKIIGLNLWGFNKFRPFGQSKKRLSHVNMLSHSFQFDVYILFLSIFDSSKMYIPYRTMFNYWLSLILLFKSIQVSRSTHCQTHANDWLPWELEHGLIIVPCLHAPMFNVYLMIEIVFGFFNTHTRLEHFCVQPREKIRLKVGNICTPLSIRKCDNGGDSMHFFIKSNYTFKLNVWLRMQISTNNQ